MATVVPNQARTGRWAELLLLIVALALSFFAYAQVGLAMTGSLPAEMNLHAAGFGALALVVHLLLRWRAPYADPVILPLAVALNGVGLAMIYRLALSYGSIEPNFADIASRQLMWTVVGVGVAVLTILLVPDHRILRRFTYTSMILGLICLVLPMVPGIGQEINGARIWIRLGPLSFQPAELTKILLTVFFAGYLVNHRETMSLAGPKLLGLRLPRLRDTAPLLLAWATSVAVLIYQTDLGTSLLFFGVFVIMLYVATDRPSWIVIGLTLSVGGVLFAYKTFSHVQERFEIWRHPFDQNLIDRPFGGSGQLV
ncbi:MAG: FtsW/RodA/SpoVE family cell cycle protein, partial [Micrococcales bacterium]|nr:FtsW/RodA/SpoVE family cell cycle protein [Micrococcales bacterium]